MPALPLIAKQRIAIALIVLELILNTATRFYGHSVFVWGNMCCLIILTIVLLLLSEGTNFVIALLLLGTMINPVPEALFYKESCCEFRINDALFLTAWLIATLDYGRRSHMKGGISWLLVCLIPIKLYSQNSIGVVHYWGFDRYIAYMGNAAIYLGMAVYIGKKLLDAKPAIRFYLMPVPILLITDTFNEFQDHFVTDPYDFRLKEIILTGLVLLTLIIRVVRKQYVRSPQRKRLFNHILLASVVFVSAVLLMLAERQ